MVAPTSRLPLNVRTLLRLTIVGITVLVLAFALWHSRHRHPATESTVVIRLEPRADDAALTRNAPPRIAYVVADGVLLRLDVIERSGSWVEVQPDGPYLPAVVDWARGDGPSALTFRARSFVMLVQNAGWPGTLRVLQDDRPVHAVDLTSAGNWIRLESPATRGSIAGLALALLACLAVAWRFAPLRQGRSTLGWLVASVSVLHIVFWASQTIAVEPDSPAYLESFSAFLSGEPSYFPPGYPVFLGVITAVFGDRSGLWLTLLQHAMVVTTAAWTLLLLRRLVPEEVALLGGLIAGGLACVLTASQWVMSEIPTLFTMTGALYFGLRSAETGRLAYSVLSGSLLGWGITMRVVPLIALAPGIVHLHLAARNKPWRAGAVTLGTGAAVVLMPLLWFLSASGDASLANSSGLHLFNRLLNEQEQMDAEGPATRALMARMNGDDPRGMNWWDLLEHPGLQELSEGELSEMIRPVAIEAIWVDPVAYVRRSFTSAWEELVSEYSTNGGIIWGTTATSRPQWENSPPLRLTLEGLAWRERVAAVSRLLWPVLCGAAILGALLGATTAQWPLIAALVWALASYLFVSASLDNFNPRHNVELTPFVVALAMVPLGMLLQRISPAPRAAVTER